MVNVIYEEGFIDGTKANFATILYILSRDYGFGKKRLLNMKKKVETEYLTMQRNPLNKGYNQKDLMKYLIDKYEIDLNKSDIQGGKTK